MTFYLGYRPWLYIYADPIQDKDRLGWYWYDKSIPTYHISNN